MSTTAEEKGVPVPELPPLILQFGVQIVQGLSVVFGGLMAFKFEGRGQQVVLNAEWLPFQVVGTRDLKAFKDLGGAGVSSKLLREDLTDGVRVAEQLQVRVRGDSLDALLVDQSLQGLPIRKDDGDEGRFQRVAMHKDLFHQRMISQLWRRKSHRANMCRTSHKLIRSFQSFQGQYILLGRA
jgi:hypothetical protein